MRHCYRHNDFRNDCQDCRRYRDEDDNDTSSILNSAISSGISAAFDSAFSSQPASLPDIATPDFGGFGGGDSGGGGASGSF